MGWRDDHWCVQAFFQQLPALLGVVIGAFATYAATSAAASRRGWTLFRLRKACRCWPLRRKNVP